MAIRLLINAQNMEVTDKLREYIERKADKLDRFMDILEEAKVDLRYAEAARDPADRQVAQITVSGKGALLRAEVRTDDIYASVDAASDKVLRQIEKYKGRHWDRRGDGRSAAEVAPDVPAAVEEEEARERRIVRRKDFLLQPMDETEAMEQMELLGHESFFVYLDGNTGRVNVLYRRRDDTYGLIETRVA